MRKIVPSDISVVVQGAVNRELTPRCLTSIRKYLPGAEIILSTWQGTNVSGLEYDRVLLNQDPGGTDCSTNGTGINNGNREIVSTFAGVKQANRKYVIKTRTDILFQNNNILKLKFLNRKREQDYSYLHDRVLVCSVYSRVYGIHNETGQKAPILFHPSDWIYFGLREDIFDLFNIPLTVEPEFSQWFKDKPQERNGYQDIHPFRLWKFSPEAYIWTEYLRKNHQIHIQDKLDITPENINLSNHSLVNNFYMADQCQMGIKLAKYNICQPRMERRDREGLYTNIHWQREYKRYCDPRYIIHPTFCQLGNYLVDLFKLKRRKR